MKRQAVWKDTVIAESDRTLELEGNTYFPSDSIQKKHLRPSLTTSVCPGKGLAHYFDVIVGDDMNKDAAWTYPEPAEIARNIKDHVAFWNGIEVRKAK